MENIRRNKEMLSKGLKKDQYDAIIVGAGIGGLVCGCYLVKAGMKVLIIEKNGKPGGYCTSFEKEGFEFDGGVHSLSGARPGGPLGRVVDDFDLRKVLNFYRPQFCEIVSDGVKTLKIGTNLCDTIEEFSSAFPKEKGNIQEFFSNLKKFEILSSYNKYINFSFDKVIKQFNLSIKVQNFIKILLSSMAIPFEKLDALTAMVVLKEYFSDGGYYPEDGMQMLADQLFERFIKWGGRGIFLKKVDKIIVKRNSVEGVSTSCGNVFYSNIIICNGDFHNMISNLVDKKYLNSDSLRAIKKINPSLSAFLLFLGLKKPIFPYKSLGFWFFPVKNVATFLKNVQNGKIYKDKCVFCIPNPRDATSLVLMSTVPFVSDKYWKLNKDRFANELIDRAEKALRTNLANNIVIKEVASPLTLRDLSLNYKGAIRGWGLDYKQMDLKKVITQTIKVKGLHSVGHWSVTPFPILEGGVSMVAHGGRYLAKKILLEIKK